MKSVLLSIRPKWCELIASGKKTIEVRKTRPKISMPFKCYIYCTGIKSMNLRDYVVAHQETGGAVDDWSGKVIGEFVCNCITGLKADNGIQTYYNRQNGTCLSDAEIIKYASGKKVYYWHISDLVIYDKPKELIEFRKVCKYRNDDGSCRYYEIDFDCQKYDFNSDGSVNLAKCLDYIDRPPKSWCYVEELL